MSVSADSFKKIPFSDVERVGQASLLYRDLFSVSWVLGRFCNYKCSYCWPFAHSSKPDHRPLPLLIKTMDEIKRRARDRKLNSYHFSFTGGEPFLHKGFLPLLEHYSRDTPNSNYQSVQVTTNLSQGIKQLEKYVQAVRPLHSVTVTASFHSEFSKKEIFADKIKFLQENETVVIINIVMVPKRFDELWETALYFQEREINVTLKPQVDEKAEELVKGYTPSMLKKLQEGLPMRDYLRDQLKKKQKKFSRPIPKGGRVALQRGFPPGFSMELTDSRGKPWYMDQAERLNAFNFNRFKNWECSAGYRSLIIREPGGSVKRGHSCRDEPLGDIETGFRLLNGIKPCITSCCACSGDSKIPKRKKGSSFPLSSGGNLY